MFYSFKNLCGFYVTVHVKRAVIEIIVVKEECIKIINKT